MNVLIDLLHARDEAGIISLISQQPELLSQTDKDGISGFTLIAYYQLHTAFKVALSLKSDWTLYEATIAGFTEKVMAKLTESPDLIHTYSPDGFPLLTLAVYFKQPELAKWYIENGVDIHKTSTNTTSLTALHSAVAVGDIETGKLLLKEGIDVNAKQALDVTPLHAASHRGNLPFVKLLIEYGAETGLQTNKGQTASDLAKENGYTEVVEYLKDEIVKQKSRT